MDEGRFIDGGLRPFIRFFETIYTQNLAMKQQLKAIPGLEWRQEEMLHMAHVEHEHEVRTRFERIYASIENQDELYAAIQEFLGIKRTL